MLRKHRFVVGSADLNVAHRTVSTHGLALLLTRLMQQFGMNNSLIVQITTFFRNTSFGHMSFSLPELLGQRQLLSG